MCRKKIITTFALSITSFFTFAQITNEGLLYVGKNSNLVIYSDFINKSTADHINDGNVYYHKNLYNQGIISFTASNGGHTFFVGNEIQIIQTDIQTDFYNLTFENTTEKPIFKLIGDISVENKVYFNSGIVENSPFKGVFKFNEKADYLHASNQSYVDGKVTKYRYDSFVFPVGGGGYLRELRLETSSDQSAATQYFFKNSNSLFSHQKKEPQILLIDNKEYWEIQVNDSGKHIITLKWNAQTTPADITAVGNGSSLKVVFWNPQLEKWQVKDSASLFENEQITAVINHSGIYTLARVQDNTTVNADIKIYNAISPNNDGLNDIFLIENIEKYPNNSLEIYNRWGALVYETKNYGISDNWFRGVSKGNTTITKGERLKKDTYFYILTITDANGNNLNRTGYLYIN